MELSASLLAEEQDCLMMLKQKTDPLLSRYLDCFGRYRRTDPICKKWCALALRCIIEQEQNERFEIIEELVSVENFSARMN